MSATPFIDKNKCNLCSVCVKICPMEVFEMTETEVKIVNDKCIDCKACELQCDKNAIKVEEE